MENFKGRCYINVDKFWAIQRKFIRQLRNSDDTALCTDMDLGWGWLAKRGYDFIQTDRTGMLAEYLEKNNLRCKKKQEIYKI